MTKAIKRIAIVVDGHVYRSSEAPAVKHDGALDCPACGSSRYRHVLTIVQHGFIEDNCLSLVNCEACRETFHYQYHVDSMYAVVQTFGGLEPGEAGLNNIEHLGQ